MFDSLPHEYTLVYHSTHNLQVPALVAIINQSDSRKRKVTRILGILRLLSLRWTLEQLLELGLVHLSVRVFQGVFKIYFFVECYVFNVGNWKSSMIAFYYTTNFFNCFCCLARCERRGHKRSMEERNKNSYIDDIKDISIRIKSLAKARGKSNILFEEEGYGESGYTPICFVVAWILSLLIFFRQLELADKFRKIKIRLENAIVRDATKRIKDKIAWSGKLFVAWYPIILGRTKVGPCSSHVLTSAFRAFFFCLKILEQCKIFKQRRNAKDKIEIEFLQFLHRGTVKTIKYGVYLEIKEVLKCLTLHGEDSDNHCFSIGTYLRRNEVSEAFNLFQDAKKHGNIPVSTYTNLMQHLFWKNEFQKGLELYNEMLEMGIPLDSVAITAVAAGYTQQNCTSEAWKVFKSMDEKGIKPTSKSYTILIKELCKVSKTDEIVKVLTEMKVRKVNVRDDIFRQVVSYMEKQGEIEKLNEVMRIQRGLTFCPRGRGREELNADQRNQPGLIGKSEPNQIAEKRLPDCFPESSARFYDNSDIKEVCRILNSSTDWCFIQEKLENLHFHFTPDLVVDIVRNSGLNIGTALKFFSWIGKQTGYSHNELSYNMALKIAGQGKNFKQMRSLFYEMSRRGCSITSDTWTIMIMQYGRTGLTDIALSNFREMKLSGCKPTKSTYSSLITSLCGKKGRKVDEAIQIYQEMVQVGCAPDKELVETYVDCLCEVNKLSDARSCIESLHKFGFSVPLSYSLYFRALCRAGKLEDALALMDEIGSERNLLDQYTYGSLIHGLLRRGRLEEALAKMKSLEQLGAHPTVHVYTALMIHFLKEKEINRALETLEEMKERGCQPTIVTYSALICGYVRLGKVSDAWNVFDRLKQKGPSPDFKTYSMFIDCLCKVGKSEEAFKLISEMLHDGIIPSTINFRTIIYGLNREGKPNLAQVVLKKKLDLKRRRKMVTQGCLILVILLYLSIQ
ncbi:hypothetical protein DH2020_004220 [Rehmannia glutinosa]|uniref:Pentatricopeptide repeat-containing protein n=1 Tax=Rehmannia glutinosa TaxID=99300 RepID=A0ABR0XP22_REHGL